MPIAISPHGIALGALQGANRPASASLERQTSGLPDHPARGAEAGVIIDDSPHAKERSLSAAVRHANDAFTLTQTAGSALGQVGDALQRMRDLAVQASETPIASRQRESLNTAFEELAQEVQRVISGTRVKGQAILGADAGVQTFPIAAGTSAVEPINVTTPNLAEDPGVKAVVGDGDTVPSGLVAAVSAHHLDRLLKNIDHVIQNISGKRAALDVQQSRFESVIAILRIGLENQATPPGRITDSDAAAAAVQRSRAKILQMAGAAMSAQANLASQTARQLLEPDLAPIPRSEAPRLARSGR